jgi:sugar fermentation stimulation protein A
MFYTYPPLLAGTLIRRYKRFMADIELASGEVITAHCPNTGPMTGIYTPGAAVYVSKSDNPNRKLAYTWELIQVQDNEPTWVGVNTSLPNRVIQVALEKGLLPLGTYRGVRREVAFGQEGSRVDFCLDYGDDRPLYLEVKNTTWAQGRRALFPDTVTTRGQKHLRELQGVLPQGRAAILYFINRSDCEEFAPGDGPDPHYGQLLRQAVAAGVEVLPCRFLVSPQGIAYGGLVDLVLP